MIQGDLPWSSGLLIGVNYYPDPQVSNLRFAVADASELYNVLRQPLYRFDPERLRLLQSVNEYNNQATRRNILRHLKQLAEQAHPEERLLFYYAGHGVSINNAPYLCPADAEYELLQQTSIPLSQIREIIANSRASIKLLILDACQVGVSLGGEREGAVSTIDVRAFEEQVREVFSDVQGIAVLAASSITEVAKESAEKGHGVFTWYLLEALKNLEGVEQNRDNYITVMELFDYVSRRLREEYGQQATIRLEGSGDLYIFTLPPRHLSTNPFNTVFPQPVKREQDFFGHEEALRQVREKLLATADALIFIHGERGIGRTSFINRIKTMLDQERQVDVQFLHFSIEPGSIETVVDLARELWDGLVRVCQRALSNYPGDKPFCFNSYTGFCFDLEDILILVPDVRVVVFIDDAEKLFKVSDRLLDKQVLALIEYIIQDTNLPIAFVLSSLYDQEVFFQVQERGSPPSNLDIRLEPLQRLDCDAMLNSFFEDKIVDRELVYERVYRLSGGNPYLHKLIASCIWDAVSKLEIGDLEWGTIISQSIEIANPLFNFIYQSIGDEERFVLLNLSLHPSFIVTSHNMTSWKKHQVAAARNLERKFYLLSLPEGGYRLRTELLGEWLRCWLGFSLECERLGLQTIEVSQPDAEGVCVDVHLGKVYVNGKEIETPLSNLQYQALVYLVRNTGRVVSRQELYEALHAQDESYLPTDQSLDALIYRLRIALGDRQQRYLQTWRRRGYRLTKGRALNNQLHK